MKKLFISQPMAGKSEKEIRAEHAAGIQKAKEMRGEDVEVIDTYFTDFGPDAKPLEYLGRSISELAKADVAYFANGWSERRGCQIEYICADQYGIPTIAEEN